MKYYLVLACGHGLMIRRKVFSPQVGDRLRCMLCLHHPHQKVVSVSSAQETPDGATYNG